MHLFYSITIKKKIIFGLSGLCLILLWFVICFLTVKILNYSQPNTNLPDLGFHDRFTQDWIEAAQKWSRITIQSRNEHTAVVKSNDLLPWKGDSFYVQTSHTNVFLGLITDGVPYYPLSKPPPTKLKKFWSLAFFIFFNYFFRKRFK